MRQTAQSRSDEIQIRADSKTFARVYAMICTAVIVSGS